MSNDLIRRSDVEWFIQQAGGEGEFDVGYLLSMVTTHPPDPVAVAARELADIIDAAQRHPLDGRPIKMWGLSGPAGQAALDRFRAAKEAEDE